MGKKSGFTSAEIEEIKRLYLKEGRSILQIPKILGKGSENSVRNALHKARIKNAPEERIKLDRFKPEQIYGEVTLLKRLTKSKKLRFHARCSCGYEFDVDPFRLTLPKTCSGLNRSSLVRSSGASLTRALCRALRTEFSLPLPRILGI